MEQDLFVEKPKWPGASARIKRCLTTVDLECPALKMVIQAAGRLRLTAEAPAWKPQAWAHVGIPSKKLAIVFMQRIEDSLVEKHKKAWAQYGWRCIGASREKIANATLAQVIDVLRTFTKES